VRPNDFSNLSVCGEGADLYYEQMVRTHGLTHVALAVKDAKRSLRFYREVFGVVAVYDENGFVQAQTPGSRDVIVFEERRQNMGKHSGVMHFGFRLVKPEDIDAAAAAVKKAGGKILRKGDFCPGEPYLFFADPDGYEVEIWYELPTPLDPPRHKIVAAALRRRDSKGKRPDRAGRLQKSRRKSLTTR
jgi:catechol 2,3-dioxygenase-like lactoylglutathione lyase family enzyme